jgi:cysteinyl-tRNA synthetase
MGPRPPRVYRRRGNGNGLSSEQIGTISDMVAERSVSKSVFNYDRADEIYAELTTGYNVNIEDRAGEWALLNEEYTFNSAGSSFMPDETIIATIGERLGDRILARKRRDFDTADDIRDELRDDYAVEIDDGNKEWTIVSPRGAMWADDDNDYNNDDGGGKNVVSKEEWDAEDDDDDVNDGRLTCQLVGRRVN